MIRSEKINTGDTCWISLTFWKYSTTTSVLLWTFTRSWTLPDRRKMSRIFCKIYPASRSVIYRLTDRRMNCTCSSRYCVIGNHQTQVQFASGLSKAIDGRTNDVQATICEKDSLDGMVSLTHSHGKISRNNSSRWWRSTWLLFWLVAVIWSRRQSS